MHAVYIKYYSQQQQGGRLSLSDEEFGNVLRLPKVYQRGHGLGGIFGNFWKYLQPLLVKGATFLKDELIDTGADVLRNINTQKPMKEILRDRSMKMVDKLRDSAVDKINTMIGSGTNRRRGNRKRKGAVKKSINKRTKRGCRQIQTLAVRVKRPTQARSKIKNKNHRILDIFT